MLVSNLSQFHTARLWSNPLDVFQLFSHSRISFLTVLRENDPNILSSSEFVSTYRTVSVVGLFFRISNTIFLTFITEFIKPLTYSDWAPKSLLHCLFRIIIFDAEWSFHLISLFNWIGINLLLHLIVSSMDHYST